MKLKIVTLVTLAVLMATTIFASNNKSSVHRQIVNAFNEKFIGAKDVTWNKTNYYVWATFTLSDKVMFAYFTQNGDLIGVSRNILHSELPLKLQAKLKKYFADGWLTELFEFATDEETIYYATIENADQKIKLLNTVSGSWAVYKKVTKIEP